MKSEGRSSVPSRVFDWQQKQEEKMRRLRQQASEDATRSSVASMPALKKQESFGDFDKRYIFVIPGGQDILGENLSFTYVEINERLAQFVSPAVWKSEAARRLTLN